jgi:type IX secretion system PorP/SprF family membrane protein
LRKNRTYKKYLLATLLILGKISCLVAQDLHFSQFFEAPLLRNPSLAGLYDGDIRVQGVYRNQWNSISFPYQTGSLNAEYKFPVGKGDDFFTAGVQLMFDRAGTVALTTTHFLPALNFHKSLSESRNTYLSLGFMGGMVSRRLDMSKVTTNNQYDGFSYNGSLPTGEIFDANYSYLDMTVGMSLSTTLGSEEQHLLFGGLAYHHFNKPVNAFYRNINHLPKWVLSGGLKMNLDIMSYVTFHGDYNRQGPHQTAIAGAMYSRKVGDEDQPTYTVHLGTFYRYKDALIPVVKMDWYPISVSFSYDINMSALTTASASRGGLETSLSYITYLENDNSSKEKLKCPKF